MSLESGGAFASKRKGTTSLSWRAPCLLPSRPWPPSSWPRSWSAQPGFLCLRGPRAQQPAGGSHRLQDRARRCLPLPTPPPPHSRGEGRAGCWRQALPAQPARGGSWAWLSCPLSGAGGGPGHGSRDASTGPPAAPPANTGELGRSLSGDLHQSSTPTPRGVRADDQCCVHCTHQARTRGLYSACRDASRGGWVAGTAQLSGKEAGGERSTCCWEPLALGLPAGWSTLCCRREFGHKVVRGSRPGESTEPSALGPTPRLSLQPVD